MQLTNKQTDIVLLMAEGLKSAEIAERLFISELTVDNHRKAILKTSGYRNWNQFMAEIGTNGLLTGWRERNGHSRPPATGDLGPVQPGV